MLQIRLKLTDNFFAPKYNPIPYFSQKSSREGWVHDKHWLQLRPTRQTSKTKNQTALSYRYSEEVAYTLQKCKLLHLHAKSQFALKWQRAPAGSWTSGFIAEEKSLDVTSGLEPKLEALMMEHWRLV